MTSKGVADVVFCLDASASMSPCIEGVKAHIADFVAGLASGGQTRWDLRLDFFAHCAGGGFCARTVACDDALAAIYGRGGQDLFTPSTERFRTALGVVVPAGNEAGLFALDCCLDFPWRRSTACHRVIVMLTDEPFETGVHLPEQRAKVQDLVAKIQALRVMLYLVAPQSQVYDEIATADRSEYQVVDSAGAGLASVDFGEVLGYIGRSVSRSALQAGAPAALSRGLFGQPGWPALGGGGCHSVAP